MTASPGPAATPAHDEVLTLAHELIRIDTTNTGDSGSTIVERPAAEWVAEKLTDVAYRGQGLGTRLVRAVAAGIAERGDRAFMHASAKNSGAIRLYESIGFRLRLVTDFLGVTVPAE